MIRLSMKAWGFYGEKPAGKRIQQLRHLRGSSAAPARTRSSFFRMVAGGGQGTHKFELEPSLEKFHQYGGKRQCITRSSRPRVNIESGYARRPSLLMTYFNPVG